MFRIACSCRETDCAFKTTIIKNISLCRIPDRPITRSRSRVAAELEFNCSLGNSVNQSDMTSPEVAEKLSDLLKAIEKSVRSTEANQQTLAETNELGIRHHTDLVKLQQQQQQAQLTTLISQNSLQVGSALHPKPFSGRATDDLLSFLSHFERFSTFCGWDDEQRLRAMPLYLQGNASSWYSSLPEMFKSYQDLVKALKDQFSNPASVWLWRQQLAARKQAETEPLADYASDIRRLCKTLRSNRRGSDAPFHPRPTPQLEEPCNFRAAKKFSRG